MTINCANMAAPDALMPDLSHLTAEERKIIEEVMQRQKAEENKEQKVQQQYEKELDNIERQITERKESANKLIGTQDDAICQICQKTKFADGIGHKCYYCQLRSCARCSSRQPVKIKGEGKPSGGTQNQAQKIMWVCSLCQKRQQIAAKTGKWFNKDICRPTTPTAIPGGDITPSATTAQPFSIISSFFGSSEQQRPSSQQSGAVQQPSQKQNVPSTNGSAKKAPDPAAVPGHVQQAPVNGQQPQIQRRQSLQRGPSMDRVIKDQNYAADRRNANVVDRKQTDINQQQQQPRQNYTPEKSQPNRPDSRCSDTATSRPGSATSRPGSAANYNDDRPAYNSRQQPVPQPRENVPYRTDQQSSRPDNQISAQQALRRQQTTEDRKYSVPQAQPRTEDRKISVPQAQPRRAAFHRSMSSTEHDQHLHDADQRVRDVDQRRLDTYQQEVAYANESVVKQSRDERYREPNVGPQFDQSAVDNRRPISQQQIKSQPPANQIRDDKKLNGTRYPSVERATSSVMEDQGRFRTSRPRSFDEEYFNRPEDFIVETYVDPTVASQIISSTSDVRRLLQVEENYPIPSSAVAQQNVNAIEKQKYQNSSLNAKSKATTNARPDSADAVPRPAQEHSPQQLAASKHSQDGHRHHHHHHHHHKYASPATTASSGGGGRYTKHSDSRSKRVPCSSSDEDLPSTSECQSCDDFESGSTSERGLLRYLLGAQRVKNCVITKTGDIEKRRITKFDDMNNQHPAGQVPVTWQTSHDGTRMIGHLVLHRQSNASLGLKVVGGRPNQSGRLGAFLTRVKRGSVADVVGHLKAGDEVLEWNGRQLQDASFDDVCEVINESKHDPHVELIVSRPVGGAVNQNVNVVLKNKSVHHGSQVQMTDPMNSLVSRLDSVALQHHQPTNSLPLMASTSQLSSLIHQEQQPAMMLAASNYAALNMPSSVPYSMQKAGGQIFGKIQVSLFYSISEQQLLVGVHQAMDLPPRADGTGRNPYVKMFLLPDRNELSRRQSNTLANTCHPVWQQKFVYQRIAQQQLATRVLEITIWDYDQFGSNDFLGEALFDLSTRILDNEPRWFNLVDMDEESPARLKLRQQRLMPYSKRNTTASRSLSKAYDQSASMYDGRVRDHTRLQSCNSGYRSDSGIFEEYLKSMPPRPRTSHSRPHTTDLHPFNQQHHHHHHSDMDDLDNIYRANSRFNRPSNLNVISSSVPSSTENYFDSIHPSSINASSSQRTLPRIPADLYGEEAMRELDDKVQQLRNHGYPPNRRQPSLGRHSTNVTPSAPRRRHRRQPSFEMNPSGSAVPGYQSDESETSMSVASTHSEKPQLKSVQEFQNRLEAALEKNEVEYVTQESTMSDPTMMVVSGQPNKMVNEAFLLESNRKKSIMTRFIPGKAGTHSAQEMKKRLGFPRSEEVGIPYGMSPPRSVFKPELMQQRSFESVGSASSENSSWLQVMPPDGSLGEFIASLGPGQVVGRQVLASPCLGEIQMIISVKNNNLEVKVIRARNLVKKPGAKYNPAPYIKVYLMDGKHCVAKAKTHVAARTAEPRFDQHLIFTEPHRGRFLQISVWGDYGRMERKVFMGIGLIKLDSLDFSTPVDGWFKLYHSNSLAGTNSPGRKNSELTDASGNGSLPVGQMRS